MEKATYSISALKQCKELIRKSRWSTRLKDEHNSRCAEVNVLFASCQKLLNYVMFQPDNQLRVCRLFAESQISYIEDAIRDGSVNCIP